MFVMCVYVMTFNVGSNLGGFMGSFLTVYDEKWEYRSNPRWESSPPKNHISLTLTGSLHCNECCIYNPPNR